jgi:hypothetical protein
MNKSNRIGKFGEEIARIQIAIKEGAAAKITRTGRGHDYKSERPNIYTGEIETKYYEVKTGKYARLSKLQRQCKKELGDDYIEHRVHLSINPDAL